MPQLGEITTILTGLTLRGRPESFPGGLVRLLQLGDVDPAGSIAFGGLMSVAPELFAERYLARVGDLVFRPRGAGIAVAMMPDGQGDVLVVSPLILIRPDRDRADPAYLAWAIGSPRAQQHFALHARGTSVIGVGKRDLETLEVDLPDLETQRKVAAIVALQAAEDELLGRLRKARRRLTDALLRDMIANPASHPHRKGSST